MFEIGQFIVYGSSGVCRVLDIGTISMEGMPEGRLYYTLEQCYVKGSRIMTPVDNTKTAMRSVITREQADELIDHVRDMDMLWVEDERKREELYKSILAECDCRGLVQIIKTIYQRQRKRLEEGRKLAVRDEKYFKQAENNLYSELAVVLKMSKDEVRDYMLARIDAQQEAD